MGSREVLRSQREQAQPPSTEPAEARKVPRGTSVSCNVSAVCHDPRVDVSLSFGPYSSRSALAANALGGTSPERLMATAAGAGASCAWVASAWMRRDGLAVIREPLRQIAERGAVRFLVGEAFDMTSREAVAEAVEISGARAGDSVDNVRIFLDLRSGGHPVYHPKVYLALSESTAWLFIGSHNLTRGGMDGNYEAGVCLVCESDAPAILDTRAWFDALWAANGCTRSAGQVLHTLPSEREIDGRRDRRLLEDEKGDRIGLSGERRSLFATGPWASAELEREDLFQDVPSLLGVGVLPPALRPVLRRLHHDLMTLKGMRAGDPTLEGGRPSYHLADEAGKRQSRELIRLFVTADGIGIAVATGREAANQYTLAGWTRHILEAWRESLVTSRVKRWVFEISSPEDYAEGWRLVAELYAERSRSDLLFDWDRENARGS